ncbi:MAG: FAD-binding oxidoreductase, partial [Balneola sp.]
MIYSDGLSRKLYAQDASMYEELPIGVSLPKTKLDIVELVKKANNEGFTITARSAGTSLAGQTTGNGVIMDVSRFMTKILDIDHSQRIASVQPGVIRDSLNAEAGKHDLLFGPDTSTTNRCMIGGMIGNNSSGSFSIKYKTTREHIISVDAVLSDGSTATFKPLTENELRLKCKLDNFEGSIYRGICSLLEKNRDVILENYPHAEITRRNTGYALD